MAVNRYFSALSPLLIGASVVVVQSAAVALSAQEVEKIGSEITVQIVDSQNPTVAGSGVIIKRTGNTYIVLTAYHVVKTGKKYQIITPDKQSYLINTSKQLPGLDLAVVSFSSNKNYSVAKIGNSEKATASTTVYLTGFPAKTAVISNPYFSFNKGQVNANGAAQRDGYNLIYDNKTLVGMSGGAVLNEQGELVGIHGRVDEQQVGLGTTINIALPQMLAVGVDMGVRPAGVNVAAAPKADDFYIKATEKRLQKDYKGAIADYTQAIRLNPNYVAAYNDRGSARSELGDKQAAIADFNTALKINPNYDYAYTGRGVVRAQLGEFQAAMTDFNKAIQINPNFADAYGGRGLARYGLGDKQGAIADSNKAIQINPNFAPSYGVRGVARADLGDKQGGIADLQKAAELLRQQGDTQRYQTALEVIRKVQQ